MKSIKKALKKISISTMLGLTIFLAPPNIGTKAADEISITYMNLGDVVSRFITELPLEDYFEIDPEEMEKSKELNVRLAELRGILQGVPQRNTTGKITKQEAVRIICNIFDIAPSYTKELVFEDIEPSIDAGYINAAYSSFLVDAESKDQFGINTLLQPDEFEAILQNCISYKQDSVQYQQEKSEAVSQERKEKIQRIKDTVLSDTIDPIFQREVPIGFVEEEAEEVYINGKYIPSYEFFNRPMVNIDDLNNYGFQVTKVEDKNAIYIIRDISRSIDGMTEELDSLENLVGEQVACSNSTVYIHNRKIVSYDISHKTFIDIKDLDMFGEISEQKEQRIISIELNKDVYEDQMDVYVSDKILRNNTERTIDIYTVNLWFDENEAQIQASDQIYYGVPPEEEVEIYRSLHEDKENVYYLGTLIKKTSLGDNPYYEKDIKYYTAQDLIENILRIRGNMLNWEEIKKEKEINDLVKPSIIYGTMKWKVNAYDKGEKVEVLFAHDGSWYKVKDLITKEEGKVPWNSILIPKSPVTNTKQMTKEQLEYYVNHKDFSSDSDYFVWTDLDRQITHVFIKQDKKWSLVKSMLSSSGKNRTPTPRGFYKIQERGSRFGEGFLCKNWVRFKGSYLYHSVILDVTGRYELEPGVLGKRASHGCIRISVENSKWFYDTIPRGTTVWIN